MTLRPYLAPYGLGLGSILAAFTFAASAEGIVGFWVLLIALGGFPLIVAGFERDRIPQGRWWTAPLIAAAISFAIFVGLLTQAISRI